MQEDQKKNPFYIDEMMVGRTTLPSLDAQDKVLDFFATPAKGRLPEAIFRNRFLAFFCKET